MMVRGTYSHLCSDVEVYGYDIRHDTLVIDIQSLDRDWPVRAIRQHTLHIRVDHLRNTNVCIQMKLENYAIQQIFISELILEYIYIHKTTTN